MKRSIRKGLALLLALCMLTGLLPTAALAADLSGITMTIENTNGAAEYHAGDVARVTVKPVPADASFSGIKGSGFKLDSVPKTSEFGAFFQDQACTLPLNDESAYSVVYLKLTKEKSSLIITAQHSADILRNEAISVVRGLSLSYEVVGNTSSTTYKVGDVVKVTANLAGSSSFDGVYGGYWYINSSSEPSEFAAFYADEGCTTSLSTGTTYRTVYLKLNKATDSLTVSAQRSVDGSPLSGQFTIPVTAVSQVKVTGWSCAPADSVSSVYFNGSAFASTASLTTLPGSEQNLIVTPKGDAVPEKAEIVLDSGGQSSSVTFTKNGSDYIATFTVPNGDFHFVITSSAPAATTFTVNFDPNGGAGSMSNWVLNQGDTLTLPSCAFTPPQGKTFDKWDLGAPGAQVDITANTTVKALWKDAVSTFTVSYDPNGGTGSMNAQSVAQGEKLTLPSCAFTAPNGKVFDKWELGSGSYAAGTQVDITADTVVKALWKDKDASFTVRFHPNGGTGSMDPRTVSLGEKFTLPECGFTAPAGMEFDRWDLGTAGTFAPGSQVDITADTVVKPLWTDASPTFKVSFDPNGGTGAMADVSVRQGEKLTLPSCAFTAPAGQIFDQWDLGSAGAFAPGALADISADTTVKALWRQAASVTCTVTFEANGGSGSMAAQTVNQGEQYTLPPCAFTAPAGKEFHQWDLGSAGFFSAGAKVEITAATTAKAIWRDIGSAYTVIFDANGGSGVMPNMSVTPGTKLTLPVCTFNAPAGMIFDRWELGAAGAQADITANTTVKALWKTAELPEGTYAVTVNPGTGGSAVANPPAAAAGTTIIVTAVPDAGYRTDTITAMEQSGNIIPVMTGAGGTYSFSMPEGAVTVNVTFRTENEGEHVCPAAPFNDVDISLWYHEGIDFAIQRGMMNGTGANTFEPATPTTRGMIVTILYRLEKQPAVSGVSGFYDVEADTWYTAPVIWAAENDIVNGYGDGRFGPNDDITREQMAAILYRYAAFKGLDVSQAADLGIFIDSGSVSPYAVIPMQWAVGAKLIEGMGGGIVSPLGGATRAQIATILMRFCQGFQIS